MVNKQYTIQKGGKEPKKYSPPPSLRSALNIPLVSSQPNPMQVATNISLDPAQEQTDKSASTVYGRNITYYNDVDNEQQHLTVKDLTLSDIGRFQYNNLPVMEEKPTGTHPDSLYRIPTRTSAASSPTASPSPSINSTHRHHQTFWKAGSQVPITSSSSAFSRSKRTNLYRFLKIFWRYAKWPMGLLLLCGLLGVVVYFIVIATQPSVNNSMLSSDGRLAVDNELSIDFDSFNDHNDIDERVSTHLPPVINGHAGQQHQNIANVEYTSSNNKSRLIKTNVTNKETNDVLEILKEPIITSNIENNDVVAIFIKKQPHTVEQTTTSAAETPAIVTQVDESSTKSNLFETLKTTLNSPLFTSGIITEEKTLKPHTTKMKKVHSLNVAPVDSTVKSVGFTSGHQANFGVPIEEDERILKMLEEYQKAKGNKETSFATTTSNYRTRVSPTLPIINRYETTTQGLRFLNATDDGVCQSTSLSLCRGILHYDLTANNKPLTATEYQHFQYLIESKCSVRVAEFVCAVLEPECRPKRMGTLKPCKRICKAVLEPCAHIIASSEILTATFDCDQYPDSNDRNECEDPSRRGKCYANEFKCLDQTCIPYQWKCDNIKDCATGEDEDDCKFCERDQFRCLSNDKCIPDKWRCDQYDDCPDASDELDCFSEEDTADYPVNFGNGRVYPFAQEQAFSSPHNRPYLTITQDDRLNSAENKKEAIAADGDKYIPTAAENVHVVKKANDDYSTEDLEIQSRAASGRAVTPPPNKNLKNFSDSHEIMMTSDSEIDMKYSSTARSIDTLTTSRSQCPEGQLRCVSGKCITVQQICDKVADCPDGADESMCVYKN
ncbi:uncharacterized protein LOC134837298 [Culicoides brevitarsis]|uniref:uncharacterized protein LOC134837298 n=1 Tax=Culicoides brevitarsis TaxID=469753 RepID=UPI00307B44C5